MILEKIKVSADDVEDIVAIRIGDLRPRIAYQAAFAISQDLRVAAKQAVMFYDELPTFWRDLDPDDYADRPETFRGGFRRSSQGANVRTYRVYVNPPLVGIQFDDQARELDLETALHLHHVMRRAAQRAKAWAGDISRTRRVSAFVTDANA